MYIRDMAKIYSDRPRMHGKDDVLNLGGAAVLHAFLDRIQQTAAWATEVRSRCLRVGFAEGPGAEPMRLRLMRVEFWHTTQNRPK